MIFFWMLVPFVLGTLLLYPFVSARSKWAWTSFATLTVAGMPLLGCVPEYFGLLLCLVCVYPMVAVLAVRANHAADSTSPWGLGVLFATGVGLVLFWLGLILHLESAPLWGEAHAAWLADKGGGSHASFSVREAAGFPFQNVLGAADSGGAPEYWPPDHDWSWLVANWSILTAGSFLLLPFVLRRKLLPQLTLGVVMLAALMNLFGAYRVLSMLD